MEQVFPNILALLRARATERPEHPAFDIPHGGIVTYAQLCAEVEAIAGALHAATASNPATPPRIAIVLPNGREMSTALLGVTLVGTALPFNPAYTEAEFEAYFAETGITALLTQANTSPAAEAVARRTRLRTLLLEELQGSNDTRDPPPLPATRPRWSC